MILLNKQKEDDSKKQNSNENQHEDFLKAWASRGTTMRYNPCQNPLKPQPTPK